MNDLEFIKKACFTGYRPDKFPFKLNIGDVDFQKMVSRIETTVTALVEDDCKIFYSGMAMGFDIVCAECVLNLKKKHKGIRLICAVPYEKQETYFPVDWQQRYKYVLKQSDEIIYISKEYNKACYQRRNMFMVDNSDFVVCWYDGKNGGTRNTLMYAAKKLRYIINLNINYLEEFNTSQLYMEI